MLFLQAKGSCFSPCFGVAYVTSRNFHAMMGPVKLYNHQTSKLQNLINCIHWNMKRLYKQQNQHIQNIPNMGMHPYVLLIVLDLLVTRQGPRLTNYRRHKLSTCTCLLEVLSWIRWQLLTVTLPHSICNIAISHGFPARWATLQMFGLLVSDCLVDRSCLIRCLPSR